MGVLGCKITIELGQDAGLASTIVFYLPIGGNGPAGPVPWKREDKGSLFVILVTSGFHIGILAMSI